MSTDNDPPATMATGQEEHHSCHHHDHGRNQGTGTDPVCGMDVDPTKTPHRYDYAGKMYYFCSNGCRTKFAASPGQYLGTVPAADGNDAGHGHRSSDMQAASAAGEIRVKDPVCGMEVDPHETPHRHELHGQTYYFCSAGCRDKFAADPDRYLGDRVPEPARPDAIYTCPMHPEVRKAAGNCPICGMALEPLTSQPPRRARTRSWST